MIGGGGDGGGVYVCAQCVMAGEEGCVCVCQCVCVCVGGGGGRNGLKRHQLKLKKLHMVVDNNY